MEKRKGVCGVGMVSMVKSPLTVTTIVTKRSSLLLIPEGSKVRQRAPAVAARKTATRERERERESTRREIQGEREREGREKDASLVAMRKRG
jgi:hypothetical protein